MKEIKVTHTLSSCYINDPNSFRKLRLSQPETQKNDAPQPVTDGAPYLEIEGDGAFLHGMPANWANLFSYRRCLPQGLDEVSDWEVITFGGRNLIVTPETRELLKAGRVWVNSHNSGGFPAAFVIAEQ